jgi:hypothetical protein
MTAFPRVIAAALPVVEYEGVQIGLLAVEVWHNCTIIRIASVPLTSHAEKREREFRSAHRDWAQQVGKYAQAHGNLEGAPEGPLHPLGEPSESIDVTIADDQETFFRWQSSSWGSGSWDFTSEARFDPAVPVGATELTVRISVKGGDAASLIVRLG